MEMDHWFRAGGHPLRGYIYFELFRGSVDLTRRSTPKLYSLHLGPNSLLLDLELPQSLGQSSTIRDAYLIIDHHCNS